MSTVPSSSIISIMAWMETRVPERPTPALEEGERESEKERGEEWRGRVEGEVEWYTCDCHVIEESHVIFT